MKKFRKEIGSALLLSVPAFAWAAAPVTPDSGILNIVLNGFTQAIRTVDLSGFVTVLFWTLASIALVWQLIQLMLSRGELGDLFAQVVRWMLFTAVAWAFVAPQGIFWSLSENLIFTDAMVRFFNDVSGSLGNFTPSGIIDVGIAIVDRAINLMNMSGLIPMSGTSINYSISSLINLIVALAVFVLLVSVALEYLIMMISTYVLIYVGVVTLGFAGSSWTKDFAFGYFKAVFMSALQILGLVLIMRLAAMQFETLYASMPAAASSDGVDFWSWICRALVIGIAMKMLSSRVPNMLAGILSGNFSYSAGGALGGAVAMAASAASLAGAGAALTIAGGVQSAKNLGKSLNALAEGGKAVADAGGGQGVKGILSNFGQGAAKGWSEFSQAASQGGGEASPSSRNVSSGTVNANLPAASDAGNSLVSNRESSGGGSAPTSNSGGVSSGGASNLTSSGANTSSNEAAGAGGSSPAQTSSAEKGDGSNAVNSGASQHSSSQAGASEGNAALGSVPEAVKQSFSEAAGVAPEGATLSSEQGRSVPAGEANLSGETSGASNSTPAAMAVAPSMDMRALAGMLGRGAYRVAKGTGKGLFKGGEFAGKYAPGRKAVFYSGGVLMGNLVNLKNFTGLG